MASVQWTKFKGHGAVKAVLRHNCSDTREVQQNHSNKQLDTSKTHLNYGMYENYAEACKRYDDRIAELAPKSSKRKDQVTGLGLVFPVPATLPEEQHMDWFARCAGIICDTFGDENVMGFHVHRDEEHEYLHHETGELTTSRVHAHATVVPEYEGRLCAKQVETRANIRKLNNAIEDMSQREFGVHFLEGKGNGKGKQTVRAEDLKRKSAVKLNELAADLERREAALDARERELNEREANLQRRERALEAAVVAPTKSAAATPAAPTKRGPRSLASIKQQTSREARSVEGYSNNGPQYGR